MYADVTAWRAPRPLWAAGQGAGSTTATALSSSEQLHHQRNTAQHGIPTVSTPHGTSHRTPPSIANRVPRKQPAERPLRCTPPPRCQHTHVPIDVQGTASPHPHPHPLTHNTRTHTHTHTHSPSTAAPAPAQQETAPPGLRTAGGGRAAAPRAQPSPHIHNAAHSSSYRPPQACSI